VSVETLNEALESVGDPARHLVLITEMNPLEVEYH